MSRLALGLDLEPEHLRVEPLRPRDVLGEERDEVDTLDLHHGIVPSGVRRVAAVEEDPVAGGIADSDPVALARVPHLADLESRGLELRLRRGDVGHAQRDRRGRQRRELVVVRVRRHDRERDVAGLVLDPVVVRASSGSRLRPSTSP